MKISAGEFKAKCLKLMNDVQKYHYEIIITKYGKAVAKLTPVNESEIEESIYGCMLGEATVVGDIVSPLGEQWEANE